MATSLDQVLGTAARTDFARYRPRHVIDAVNALLPLGKDGALAAVEAWLATHDAGTQPHDGLFLVLRVLFEVPAHPGHQPPLHLGGTSPPPPPDPASLPHFPLVLIDDRPLLLVSGFALGGDTEPVSSHIRHFRANGTLRHKPLAPARPPDAVLDEFRAMYQRAYGASPPPHVLALIQAQLSAPA